MVAIVWSSESWDHRNPAVPALDILDMEGQSRLQTNLWADFRSHAGPGYLAARELGQNTVWRANVALESWLDSLRLLEPVGRA